MEKLKSIYTIDEAMKLAISLAKKGLGFVEPNPAVGCVILDEENRLIGSGYHKKIGGPHAEINALDSVSDKKKLKNSRVIVTLEPCGHTGKTPPCSQALINSGVDSVIYGVSDPNPLFSHKGIEDIKNNSIHVEKYSSNSELTTELTSLVEKFLYSQNSNKAFVSIKMGSSLDGQIALENKDSKWITGKESREHSHLLRATHDATLVGVNTLFDDNPKLNIRLEKLKSKNNKVIILDPDFRSKDFLKKSNLIKAIEINNIYIACKKENISNEGLFNFIEVEFLKNNKINLESLLEKVKALNINSVLVEGGASTISEFLSQNMFNRIYNFISPSIIGSGYGLSWTKGLVCKDLNKKIQLKAPEISRFGDDILLSFRPK